MTGSIILIPATNAAVAYPNPVKTYAYIAAEPAIVGLPINITQLWN